MIKRKQGPAQRAERVRLLQLLEAAELITYEHMTPGRDPAYVITVAGVRRTLSSREVEPYAYGMADAYHKLEGKPLAGLEEPEQ
ncbi:hypothetical protein ACIBG8_54570 [Nonomuraea sp. NPDC050556]|uniref:hypothetical protein n=1 Tax=Nonomuraea sp. NPDC050556 TaxID=3364369 RepID=UPI0037B1EAE9